MITIDIDQCSPEWFAERAGKPSASNFDRIITSQGKRSTQRGSYLYQLAGEYLLGEKAETYVNDAMQRGIDLEAEARHLYSIVTGHKVDTVGLCYRNERKRYCCSPDGLVGDDGGLEVKCPSMHTHVEYLHKKKLPAKYFCQVQGSLFITGREWWDFVSYYPGLPMMRVIVEPDEAWFKKFEKMIDEFCSDLATTILDLKGYR